MHDDIGAVIDGTAEVTACAKSIVDDDRHTMFVCHGNDFLEVRNIVARIANAFQVYGFRLVVNKFLEFVRIVAFDEFSIYAEAGKGDFELVVGASVKIGSGNDVVPCVGESCDYHELGGLARRGCYRCDAAFERCYALFEDIDRGLAE